MNTAPVKTPEKSFDEVIIDTFINLFTCSLGSPVPDDATAYTASRSDHDIAKDKYKQSLSRQSTSNQVSNHQQSISRPEALNQNHGTSSDTLSKLDEFQKKLKLEEEYKNIKNKEFSEKVTNDSSFLNFLGLTSAKPTKETNSKSDTSNNHTSDIDISAEQFEYFLGTEGIEAIIWLPTPKGKAKGKSSKIKLDRLTNSIKCDMVSKGERKSLFFQLSDLLSVTDGKGNGSTGTMPIALPVEAENNRSLYITIRDKPELNLTFSSILERDTFVKGMRILLTKGSGVSNSHNMAAQAQMQSLLSKVKK